MKQYSKGFTLIELMTAITIFTIIMMMAMGSLVNVFQSHKKSRSLRSVMANLNIAIETMAKDMRFGTNYHCGESGTLTSPQDCPSGDDFISFLSSGDQQVSYRLNGSTIEKSVDGGTYLIATSPDITIDDLEFYVLGADTADTMQPKVFIKIKGHAGSGTNRSDLDLQTMVSQRALDI